MNKISLLEIESITSIESILSECGATKIKDCGSFYQFSSPFHEDRHPSMVLYKKNLRCVDFSIGYNKPLSSFIYDSLGIGIYKYLGMTRKDRMKKNYFTIDKSNIQKFDFKADDFTIIINGGKLHKNVHDNIKVENYLAKRFVSEEFIKKFILGYTIDSFIYRAPKKAPLDLKGTPFFTRICIPIIEQGETVSIEGRDFSGTQTKKVLYPKGGTVSTLFNIDNLNKNEPLVVVEGIMDIPRIWQYITKNVTTTFGIMITKRQQKLLKEFNNIILFPDTDDAGRKMVGIFDKFYDKEYRIAFLEKGDPGDSFNSIEDIKKAITEAKKDVEYFLDKSELIPTINLNNEFFLV